MPPYLRRRLFRGWDWFTPREIQHLPWREREHLTQEAWKAVRRHPRYWLMVRFLPLLCSLAMCLAALASILKLSPLISLAIVLAFLPQSVTEFVWKRRRFREALSLLLLDADVRPHSCFECGYELEGYEGKDCPACDTPLLRQPDSSRSTS